MFYYPTKAALCRFIYINKKKESFRCTSFIIHPKIPSQNDLQLHVVAFIKLNCPHAQQRRVTAFTFFLRVALCLHSSSLVSPAAGHDAGGETEFLRAAGRPDQGLLPSRQTLHR